jgi:hypothetical protein
MVSVPPKSVPPDSTNDIPFGRFGSFPIVNVLPPGSKLARNDAEPMFGALFVSGVVWPKEKTGDSNV